jgi:hypothetical protein
VTLDQFERHDHASTGQTGRPSLLELRELVLGLFNRGRLIDLLQPIGHSLMMGYLIRGESPT